MKLSCPLHFYRLKLVGLLALCALSVPLCAQEEEPVGQAWSRIIRHYDGTQTKSVKEGDKNEITEEKYDENHVLLAKRLFLLDKGGHLRKGVIMDAKGNPLGTTEYGYKDDRIVEERLYNKEGKPIQRKFPPGALPGVAANARHSVVFTIDPKNPNAVGTMTQTDVPMITPVSNPDDSFQLGVPIGQQINKGGGTGLPNNTAPVPTKPTGRKPSFFRPQK